MMLSLSRQCLSRKQGQKRKKKSEQKQEKEEEQAGSTRASSCEASIVSFNGKPRPAQEGAGDTDRAELVDNRK